MNDYEITLIKRFIKTIEEYEQDLENLHKINRSLRDKTMELIQENKRLKGEKI